MKIITYYKTIELDECQEIYFDYEKSMVTFFIGGFIERFYFRNEDMALDFLHEVMEGIYCSSPIVDVSYITAIPEQLLIIPFKNEVEKRVRKFNPTEDEEVK